MKNSLLLILVLLLGLPCAGQSNRIYIDDFDIEPDSTATVPVMLANESPTRGFQFNMTMPAGLYVELAVANRYSKQFKMNVNCSQMVESDDYLVFVYPSSRICYPPDTVAVLDMTFYATSEFKDGEIVINTCRGSTIDNQAFAMDGDTVMVTVPSSSLIGIPTDQQSVDDKYFNLLGQPISSPGDAAVAIRVITDANGQVESRKMSVRR